ncbi:class I SAM-dependent methyltransferase [Salidesulfovibrio brasiliensis]|uniref:class I SAM-dependent methyltransferase n=1 Tax=Salidesulfovibrio brasiliensis TaxID=221711 RepID=UPI0006D0C9BD|nr:class I SAM-dependent methyltransferase [Salidesulfovibrio brasiliensis]
MSQRPVREVSTREGYDLWSSIYDTEGNPLVALDSLVLPPLLGDVAGLRVADLGCGTGRYTSWLAKRGATVTGLDFSQGMLDQARTKLPDGASVTLQQADLTKPLPLDDGACDLIVSSLVLEHLGDLRPFFAEVRRICRPQGRAVLSTMHPAMFLRDLQAHFVDEQSGEEVRFESHSHQISDFVMAALSAGFSINALNEHFGEEGLASGNPRMDKFRGWPMLFVMDLTPSQISV